MGETISVEEFRYSAPSKLSWLIERGFNRSEDLEKTTSTMGTLVYRGQHVAFEFSLDVRDQCVDAEVIRIENGTLQRNWDGGYSSDIFNHLVKKEGYRGSPTGTLDKSSPGSKLDRAIDGWLSLLKTAGSNLLSDRLESLGSK